MFVLGVHRRYPFYYWKSQIVSKVENNVYFIHDIIKVTNVRDFQNRIEKTIQILKLKIEEPLLFSKSVSYCISVHLKSWKGVHVHTFHSHPSYYKGCMTIKTRQNKLGINGPLCRNTYLRGSEKTTLNKENFC